MLVRYNTSTGEYARYTAASKEVSERARNYQKPGVDLDNVWRRDVFLLAELAADSSVWTARTFVESALMLLDITMRLESPAA